jgi:hypothetical protein
MKLLREYIRKEIKSIMETSYPMPPEIKHALKDTLGLNPIRRYINGLKAVNTLPPSYRAFLYNGRYIDIYMQDTFLQAKIEHKFYDLGNVEELNLVKKHINKILTDPIPITPGGDDESEGGAAGGGEGEEAMEPEEGGEPEA